MLLLFTPERDDEVSGIYVHIPFCRQACRYCDFYFTVSRKYKQEYIRSLLKEMEVRAGNFADKEIASFYFGGGTPSLLSEKDLAEILELARNLFSFTDDAEVTLEANPEDLAPKKLYSLRKAGINRLSIGIQSFRDEDLVLMRRSHNAAEARRAVEKAAAADFENISIDLIYGLPGQSPEDWQANLDHALSLPLAHLSAYHLTYEAGTVFDHWRKKGRIGPVPEEDSEEMYKNLRKRSHDAGYEHYEISNFALRGMYSRHNRLYWSGRPYLGLGPSAHSFDGERRNWNPSSLKKYMEQVEAEDFRRAGEELSTRDRYHDYLITSLRTSSGVDLQHIRQIFGPGYAENFQRRSEGFLSDGSMHADQDRIIIRAAHWIMADHIMRELFLDQNELRGASEE